VLRREIFRDRPTKKACYEERGAARKRRPIQQQSAHVQELAALATWGGDCWSLLLCLCYVHAGLCENNHCCGGHCVYLVRWALLGESEKTYATPLFWLPIILGLLCGVVWRITGEDFWGRLGIECICVRAAYRVIDWVGSMLLRSVS